MSSAIGRARYGLWQTLLGVTWPTPEFQVAYGYPDLPKYQGLYLLGVTTGTEDQPLIGPQSAGHEQFGIELVFKWQDPEADEEKAADVDSVAWDVVEQARAAVRANRTLAINDGLPGPVYTSDVTGFASPGTGRPAQTPDGNGGRGLLCVIDMTVTCQARAR